MNCAACGHAREDHAQRADGGPEPCCVDFDCSTERGFFPVCKCGDYEEPIVSEPEIVESSARGEPSRPASQMAHGMPNFPSPAF